MPGPINQLHGFPRLTNGPAPASFLRRGSILDGTVFTFPGPGQGPWNADGGDDEARPYEAPTDWTPEAFCLRRPQIVWCSIAAAADFPDVASDTLYDEVFPALKALVETSQPGLTWVYIPTWVNSPFEAFNKTFWGSDPFDGADAAVTTKLYSAHAGPTMTSPFFGTNFLHISFGTPFEPYTGNLLALLFSGTPLADDPIFQLGLGWITQFSTELMAGYTVWEWMYDSEFASLREPSLIAFEEASAATGANYVYQGDAGGTPSTGPDIDGGDLAVMVSAYFGFDL